MLRLSTTTDVQQSRGNFTPPVALVPTMGALHDGHRALFRAARELAGAEGTLLVSIFVNPLQFDRPADLASYPRDIEADLALCNADGVDAVFFPEPSAFYAPDHSVTVHESLLSRHLCGPARPGHFDGVCTVVLKLFHLLRPTDALFGKKDYQQFAIIRRLVRDLSVPVRIHGVPTVRDPDGVALSSRNRNLRPAHRADAPRICRSLRAARDLATCGEQRADQFLQTARRHLLNDAPPEFRLDYLELVDRETLQPMARLTKPALLATAAYYNQVRLIDNIEIDPR